jgi:hypothetical protein
MRQSAITRLTLFLFCASSSAMKGLDIHKSIFSISTASHRGALLATMTRTQFARHLLIATAAVLFPSTPARVQAWTLPFSASPNPMPSPLARAATTTAVESAYKSLWLPIDEFDVTVPVACWFPTSRMINDDESAAVANTRTSRPPVYNHRISIRKIGQLLAKWDFIPAFVARPYTLEPTISDASTQQKVLNGQDLSLPTKAPVVLLAHGFLGSRFDLSHLGEALAAQGFVVLSAEYPESLAASYSPSPASATGRSGELTRQCINDNLLEYLSKECNVQATKFGIVGHSLGCGTVVNTGDATWARVCIAGGPRLFSLVDKCLFVASMNDGAVSMARAGGLSAIPSDVTLIDEKEVMLSPQPQRRPRLPSRSALVFDRPDGPNHISFLTESVNNAMIDFLSPLLPVAQALSIPVLDFDRYQVSRDSKETARIVHPLIIQYLKQEMQQP